MVTLNQLDAKIREWQIIKSDIMEWATAYDGPKFHAILCDPPYHLTSITKRFGDNDSAPAKYGKDGAFSRASVGFMGQQWDGLGEDGLGVAFKPEIWAALAEHLYPGGFGMAFASSRGQHRMACAIEDAGLNIMPTIGWCFSTGFPKATRIDTQIDKAAFDAWLSEHPDAVRNLEYYRQRIEEASSIEAEEIAQLQYEEFLSGYRKAAGLEREVTGKKRVGYGKRDGVKDVDGGIFSNSLLEELKQVPITTPATPLARAWAGHRYGGQVLKPALEFIIVFQKPYEDRPVDNITETGAGALNVDGGRVGTDWEKDPTKRGWQGGDATNSKSIFGNSGNERISHPSPQGRWPANLILDDSETVREMFPETGKSTGGGGHREAGQDTKNGIYGKYGKRNLPQNVGIGDSGSAARFFYQTNWNYEVYEALAQADPIKYCPKPTRKERDAGLDDLPLQTRNRVNAGGLENEERWGPVEARNIHPTVKPISLCKYLATLLLPPDEYAPRRILVPFAGSGSEMIGAMLAGWDEVVGIDMSPEYCQIAEVRLAWWADFIKGGQTDIDKILGAVEEEKVKKESGQGRLF